MIIAKENKTDLVLPSGVHLNPLQMRKDARGCLTELFRKEWHTNLDAVQWNFVSSLPQVLRGFHVHLKHYDYLIVLNGKMILALKDLRTDSPTENLSALVELTGEKLTAIVIPPGVGHAFYFPIPTLTLYSVTEYWSTADELGCHWADPELGIAWPFKTAVTSDRDTHAPTFKQLLQQLKPWQPIGKISPT